MAEASVDRFGRAWSYADARDNFARLRQIPADAWTPKLASSVRQALVSNDQLRDASSALSRCLRLRSGC
jgi:hypothetical protein